MAGTGRILQNMRTQHATRERKGRRGEQEEPRGGGRGGDLYDEADDDGGRGRGRDIRETAENPRRKAKRATRGRGRGRGQGSGGRGSALLAPRRPEAEPLAWSWPRQGIETGGMTGAEHGGGERWLRRSDRKAHLGRQVVWTLLRGCSTGSATARRARERESERATTCGVLALPVPPVPPVPYHTPRPCARLSGDCAFLTGWSAPITLPIRAWHRLARLAGRTVWYVTACTDIPASPPPCTVISIFHRIVLPDLLDLLDLPWHP